MNPAYKMQVLNALMEGQNHPMLTEYIQSNWVALIWSLLFLALGLFMSYWGIKELKKVDAGEGMQTAASITLIIGLVAILMGTGLSIQCSDNVSNPRTCLIKTLSK